MSFEESCMIKSKIIESITRYLYYPVVDNSKEAVLKREQLAIQLKKRNSHRHL